MHQRSILRMSWFVENYAEKLPLDKINVLDVGSYDVNGTYKHLFDGQKYSYTGLDMAAGPNVDIALTNPYDWGQIETDSYDVIISGQAFEHVEFFWVTLSEMVRVLKKDGLLCIVAPNGFDEHRHPVDCYRFFSDGMVAMAKYVSLEPLHAHTNCAPSLDDTKWFSKTKSDSMLIAKKTYSGATQLVDLSTYKCVPEDGQRLRTGMVPFPSEKKKPRVLKSLLRKLKGRSK